MPPQNVVVDPAFPRRLREFRERAGLSLRALATKALSSKSHLADFEAGRKTPSVAAAERIDQALSAGGALARMVSPAPYSRDPALRRRTVVELGAGLAAGLAAGMPPDVYVGSGRRLVSQAQLRTARLRRLDDHLGGADTYGLYLAEMEITSARVCEGGESETTTLGLLAVMAEQAQMAGFSPSSDTRASPWAVKGPITQPLRARWRPTARPVFGPCCWSGAHGRMPLKATQIRLNGTLTRRRPRYGSTTTGRIRTGQHGWTTRPRSAS